MPAVADTNMHALANTNLRTVANFEKLHSLLIGYRFSSCFTWTDGIENIK